MASLPQPRIFRQSRRGTPRRQDARLRRNKAARITLADPIAGRRAAGRMAPRSKRWSANTLVGPIASAVATSKGLAQPGVGTRSGSQRARRSRACRTVSWRPASGLESELAFRPDGSARSTGSRRNSVRSGGPACGVGDRLCVAGARSSRAGKSGRRHRSDAQRGVVHGGRLRAGDLRRAGRRRGRRALDRAGRARRRLLRVPGSRWRRPDRNHPSPRVLEARRGVRAPRPPLVRAVVSGDWGRDRANPDRGQPARDRGVNAAHRV